MSSKENKFLKIHAITCEMLGDDSEMLGDEWILKMFMKWAEEEEKEREHKEKEEKEEKEKKNAK